MHCSTRPILTQMNHSLRSSCDLMRVRNTEKQAPAAVLLWPNLLEELYPTMKSGTNKWEVFHPSTGPFFCKSYLCGNGWGRFIFFVSLQFKSQQWVQDRGAEWGFTSLKYLWENAPKLCNTQLYSCNSLFPYLLSSPLLCFSTVFPLCYYKA